MTINNTTTPNNLYPVANATTSSNPFVVAFQPRDPTIYDVPYPIQKVWLNTELGHFWFLQNFTTASGSTFANWIPWSSSVVVETLTGNTGGAVPPTANNINVVGDGTFITTVGNPATSTLTIEPAGGLATSYVENTGTAVPSGGILNVLGSAGITTVGSGNTITVETNGTIATSYVENTGTAVPSGGILNVLGTNGITTSGSGNTIDISGANIVYYSLTPYIVGPDVHSQFTTIGAAITQAVTDGASASNPKNIYIKPQSGGYVENPTLEDGINIIGFGPNTQINGNVTIANGTTTSTISNITLNTNSNYCLTMSGASETVVNCYNVLIGAANHTAINFSNTNADSVISMDDSRLANLAGFGLWTMTSPGTMLYFNCDMENEGSTTASTNSAGNIIIVNSPTAQPFACSGTGTIEFDNCRIDTAVGNAIAITLTGTSQALLNNCYLTSGTASCASIGSGCTMTTTSVNAVSSATNVFTGAGTLNYAFVCFGGSSSGSNVTTQTALTVLT
jgi:hypothetical protein